ncbi:2-oxo-4-hydroxy-4-carboxy-5-ureidoimidazoline decarboxylase [Paenibacillus sepulcri]|uniref:2-oxo-4-hydroxy-4-carboxy-5-ureidoimidazoline decarboxylase n=1 Tax=Paenibacillus sepulcri TaxID=359917 RepID=A0ABS7CBV3_9BACL|nr:2-oxo-4-hydroxy-4-carboxy-5-ureidoimidazoline decarboxylase [Paenibacillus sepulcri]
MTISLWQLNTFSRELFVRRLGDIFENSPWVAEAAWRNRPFYTVRELHDAMMQAVYGSSSRKKLALIQAHPDLATRLQVSVHSAKEQQGADLNQLSEGEHGAFAELNGKYVEKYGFPYILAVRGKAKEEILADMNARMMNTEEEERTKALREIAQIAWFRLNDLIEENAK